MAQRSAGLHGMAKRLARDGVAGRTEWRSGLRPNAANLSQIPGPNLTKRQRHTRVNPQQPQPEEGSAEIDPIRVEMLSTEMPVHQLAKRGQEEIRIIRRSPNGGQASLYWKVEPNLGIGRPGQLAYHLDTWVIRRRLDKLRRPIPRMVRIGDLREIARELGQGGDTNAVKRAFEQNASAFIRAKLTYRTQAGGTESLEGYFNRYNVFFRGQSLPGGRTAETVYISLNDPYYALINGARKRPLDFAYLRQLTPAAQRFYELVSPKIFAAITNSRASAWMRYSDLCALAVLARQTTRRRMQIQMAAIHRPHLASGYVSAVGYRPAPSDGDLPDWIIEYTPGPRARAEFEAFNGPRRTLSRAERAPSTANLSTARGIGERCDVAAAAPVVDSTPAASLVRRFAERRHGHAAVRPSRLQLERAQEILRAVGGDRDTAVTAVDLAATSAATDRKGFPGHIGGVLQGGFVERAVAMREERRRSQETDAARTRERARRERYEVWCRQRAAERVEQLTEGDRRQIVEARLPTFIEEFRYLVRLRKWSEGEVIAWASPRILERFVRDDEPAYDEWCSRYDEPPTGTSGPIEALQ